MGIDNVPFPAAGINMASIDHNSLKNMDKGDSSEPTPIVTDPLKPDFWDKEDLATNPCLHYRREIEECERMLNTPWHYKLLWIRRGEFDFEKWLDIFRALKEDRMHWPFRRDHKPPFSCRNEIGGTARELEFQTRLRMVRSIRGNVRGVMRWKSACHPKW